MSNISLLTAPSRIITRHLLTEPPASPAQLHAWLAIVLDLRIPRDPLVSPAAPFDYLAHAFFEGRDFNAPASAPPPNHPADCVVWAARGSGKTFLAALATLLDLLFKPGIQIKLLGGSLEQSRRMHEHLRRLFDSPALAPLLAAPITSRRVTLKSGSVAEVLAASQTSVRGSRVQKVRCDEVELFDPDLWRAVQLTTRSMPLQGPWGDHVRGCVEALSTLHEPGGLMSRIVDDSAPATRRVFRWGVLDVLAPCPTAHTCDTCIIHDDCQGRIKQRDQRPAHAHGFISIDDAVRLRSRVDRQTWESEMLCLRPNRSRTVYPMFDPAIHVVPAPAPGPPPSGRFFAAMDFGFVGEAAVLLARLDHHGTLWIEREHIRAGMRVEDHARVISQWDADIRRERGGELVADGLDYVAIDPAGLARNEHTGISSADILRRAGLKIKAPRSPIMRGVRLVRARLEALPARAPTLFIRDHCTRLIHSLRNYRFDPAATDRLEPLKDGHDHACDALRYLTLSLDSATPTPWNY
ncbi:MAG TPA: hypothetical protein PL072_09780 [Phycisphaerales bacterium]|nr:hypothetical protein [Phycisphaerales bacterium]